MTTYVRVHVYILFHALGYGMHASDVFFFLKKNMCVHTAHGFHDEFSSKHDHSKLTTSWHDRRKKSPFLL